MIGNARRVTTAVSLMMIGLVLASGCTAKASATSAPPSSTCTAEPDELAAVQAYRDAFAWTAPVGLALVSSVVRTASCSTEWPAPAGIYPPKKRLADIETDYRSDRPLSAADLRNLLQTAASAGGWQVVGFSDDALAPNPAWAVYCQNVNGVWAVLSAKRAAGSGGAYPVEVVVEGYPGDQRCPGRSTDG